MQNRKSTRISGKKEKMPEIIFPGPEGRLHGRFHPQQSSDAPIAIILHPHPQYGGSMNNKVVYNLHYTFFNLGFSCLRFNFRGIGKSQGQFDQGVGELSDAASTLDYLQLHVPNARSCWVAGFSFGAWIAMQLLMRRPEDSRSKERESMLELPVSLRRALIELVLVLMNRPIWITPYLSL